MDNGNGEAGIVLHLLTQLDDLNMVTVNEHGLASVDIEALSKVGYLFFFHVILTFFFCSCERLT